MNTFVPSNNPLNPINLFIQASQFFQVAFNSIYCLFQKRQRGYLADIGNRTVHKFAILQVS